MLDELLSPLRLPERALGALEGIGQDLAGLRGEMASGLGALEVTTASMRADMAELSTRVERLGNQLEGTLEETSASIHADITELGTRLESLNRIEDTLEETNASIHAGLPELSARVRRLGKQLDVLPTPQLVKGDLFPALTLESAGGTVEVCERWRKGPLVVAFMRHFGCPFCREHLARLDQARDEIQVAGGDVVAIFQNRGRHVRDFCDQRGVGLECLGDPRREGYGAVSLRKGSWKEYLGPKLAKRYVQATRFGHRPGLPRGDVAQRPGTFVVGTNGRVAFAHYNRDSSDNPTTDAIVAAVRHAARA